MFRFRHFKTAVVLVLSFFIVFIAFQLFKIYGERARLAAEVLELEEKNLKLEEENRKLAADIEYFKIPENLEKELRSRFNYRAPGEKLIIIPEKR